MSKVKNRPLYKGGGTTAAVVGMITPAGIGKNVAKQGSKNGLKKWGSKGKPDHQKKVEELFEKAKKEKGPDDTVLREKKIGHPDSNRKPDVQIVDKDGNCKQIYEAERHPNWKRNQNREKEYDDLGIPHETHPLE